MPSVIKERVKPAELPVISPSAINLFLQSKALWVLKHFYGLTSQMNIYAMRGVAIENAVNAFFRGDAKTREEAAQMAVEEFQTKAFFWGDQELSDSIEAKIGPWVEQAIKSIVALDRSEKLELQNRVDTEIEGLKVGGFVDYTFVDGLQLDLKTCNTLPSVVTKGPRKGLLPKDKDANVNQQSVYYKARPLPTALLFVSPEGSLYHHLAEDETNAGMKRVEAACREIKWLLESDMEDIIASTVPNWKTMEYGFYWDEKLRKAAHDIWWDYEE